MRGWNRCDECGKFRDPKRMQRGENPTMDGYGHISDNYYQICEPGYGCSITEDE